MDSLQPSRGILLCLLIVGLCLFGPVPGQGQPPTSRTDSLGDPLPEGAIARLGTTRLRHPGAINVLLFTDDGKSLISLGDKGVPCAWDVESGKRIETDANRFELLDKATGNSILARSNPALWSAVAFGREGNTLLTVNYDRVVTAWDIESGKETSKRDMNLKQGALPRREKSTTTSALVRFVDPPTGEERENTIRLSYIQNDWSLADDGKHFRVHYWGSGEERKIESGQTLAFPHSQRVTGLRITLNVPEKKLAVLGCWEHIAVKDLANDKFIWTTPVVSPSESGRGSKQVKVECLALSPDGKTVAAGTDSGHIELLDLATGERVGGSRLHPGFFSGPVQFVPGGKFILVTMGREGVLWDLLEGKKVRGFGVDSYDDLRVVSPDGESLLIGEWSENAYKMTLQNTVSGKPLWALDDGFGGFTEAQFSSDGQTVAIYSPSEPQSVIFVSTKTGEWRQTFRPHDQDPESPLEHEFSSGRRVKVSPEMLIATETNDGQRIQLWDPSAGKKLWTWTMPADCRGHLHAVHFVPGGKHVLVDVTGRTDNKENLFVIDAKNGEQLESIRTLGLEDLSPDGRFMAYYDRSVTPGADGTDAYDLQVRDLQSGETALKLELVDHSWRSMRPSPTGRFSADSKIFAYYRGDSIAFYDLQTKQQLGPPRPQRAPVWGMGFAPSGNILATYGNDSNVILWDAQALSP